VFFARLHRQHLPPYYLIPGIHAEAPVNHVHKFFTAKRVGRANLEDLTDPEVIEANSGLVSFTGRGPGSSDASGNKEGSREASGVVVVGNEADQNSNLEDPEENINDSSDRVSALRTSALPYLPQDKC
jgi:hypothetical protein